jgi:hypothetical protein
MYGTKYRSNYGIQIELKKFARYVKHLKNNEKLFQASSLNFTFR